MKLERNDIKRYKNLLSHDEKIAEDIIECFATEIGSELDPKTSAALSNIICSVLTVYRTRYNMNINYQLSMDIVKRE